MELSELWTLRLHSASFRPMHMHTSFGSIYRPVPSVAEIPKGMLRWDNVGIEERIKR